MRDFVYRKIKKLEKEKKHNYMGIDFLMFINQILEKRIKLNLWPGKAIQHKNFAATKGHRTKQIQANEML